MEAIFSWVDQCRGSLKPTHLPDREFPSTGKILGADCRNWRTLEGDDFAEFSPTAWFLELAQFSDSSDLKPIPPRRYYRGDRRQAPCGAYEFSWA